MKNTIVRLKSQQGDILLRRLDKMPSGNRKVVSKGRCILAHGESGNIHLIEQDDAELIAIGERMLLSIEAPAEVTHGEHGTQTLAPGVWEIGRVREKDWFTEMVRPVQD